MRPPIALAATLSMLATGVAHAAPIGTLLFAQDGVQIINPQGQSRPARRGDALEPGERLVTPENAATQIRLLDGSLVGVRPGSELTVNLPDTASGVAQQIISLLSGKVRVIGSELIGGKPAPLLLNAGDSRLQMNGADLEAAVVPKGRTPTDGGAGTGSYSRLLVGTAQLNVGATVVPLAPREVNFVATGALPVLASISPAAVFADPRTLPGVLSDTARTAAPPKPGDTLASKTPLATFDTSKIAALGDRSRFDTLSPTRSTLTAQLPPSPVTPPVVANALATPVVTKLPSLQIQPIATAVALPPPMPTPTPIAIAPLPILQPIVLPLIKPPLLLPTCRLILGQMICS